MPDPTDIGAKDTMESVPHVSVVGAPDRHDDSSGPSSPASSPGDQDPTTKPKSPGTPELDGLLKPATSTPPPRDSPTHGAPSAPPRTKPQPATKPQRALPPWRPAEPTEAEKRLWPADDRLYGGRGSAADQVQEWKGHRYDHGRPAWASDLIDIPDAVRPGQMRKLTFRQCLEAVTAAYFDLGSAVRHPPRLKAWCKADDARPGLHALNAAAERAGLNLEAVVRLAGVALNADEPIDTALDAITVAIEGGETVATAGAPVTARPRKRKSGRSRQAPAKAVPGPTSTASTASTGQAPATGAQATLTTNTLSPMPRPAQEVVTEHWENKYFECLAALQRVVADIDADCTAHWREQRKPFSIWDERCAADPALPRYPNLLYTCRRYGTTPLKLLALARAREERGLPMPEPVKREVTYRESPAVGEAAIAEALARGFTPADLRCATRTWPLNECLDAMIDAIPDLPPSAEFGRQAGWPKLERGRDDIPTFPTLKNCCDAHGLTVHELLAAAREARAQGRGFTARVRHRGDSSPLEYSTAAARAGRRAATPDTSTPPPRAPDADTRRSALANKRLYNEESRRS